MQCRTRTDMARAVTDASNMNLSEIALALPGCFDRMQMTRLMPASRRAMHVMQLHIRLQRSAVDALEREILLQFNEC